MVRARSIVRAVRRSRVAAARVRMRPNLTYIAELHWERTFVDVQLCQPRTPLDAIRNASDRRVTQLTMSRGRTAVNNSNSRRTTYSHALAYVQLLQRRERAETSHGSQEHCVVAEIELTQCAKTRDVDCLVQVAIVNLSSRNYAPSVSFFVEAKVKAANRPTTTCQQKPAPVALSVRLVCSRRAAEQRRSCRCTTRAATSARRDRRAVPITPDRQTARACIRVACGGAFSAPLVVFAYTLTTILLRC